MAEVTTLHRQRDESSRTVEHRGFCLILASFLARESDSIDFSKGATTGVPVCSSLTTFPKRQNGSHYFSSTSRAILLRLFSEEAIDIRSLSGPDSSCLQFDVRMLSLHQLLWLRVKYQKYYLLLTRANHEPQVRLLESVEATLLEGLASKYLLNRFPDVKATPNDRRLLGLEMVRSVSQQLAIGGSHIWRLFAKNGEIKVASEARESKFTRQPSGKGSIRSRSLSRAPAYASAGLEVFLELPAHNVLLVRPSDAPVVLVVDVGTTGNASRAQWDVLEVNANVTNFQAVDPLENARGCQMELRQAMTAFQDKKSHGRPPLKPKSALPGRPARWAVCPQSDVIIPPNNRRWSACPQESVAITPSTHSRVPSSRSELLSTDRGAFVRESRISRENLSREERAKDSYDRREAKSVRSLVAGFQADRIPEGTRETNEPKLEVSGFVKKQILMFDRPHLK